MKTAPAPLIEQLKNAHAIKALPEVIVDWNMNRYHDTRVDNEPPEEDTGFDIELFPVESIAEPNRPRKGINKARVGQATVSAEYYDEPGTGARFYVADHDDVYKYWTSPLPAVDGVIPTVTIANFPEGDGENEYPALDAYDGLTSARPFVEYTDDAGTVTFVPANKIVIKLENSWASPDDFDIVITRDGATHTVQGSNITGWEASGEIVLYWNGTSWSVNNTLTTDEETNFPIYDQVSKIQLVVRTLREGYGLDGNITQRMSTGGGFVNTTGRDSFLDVIEIGAHLEADLSPWVIETTDAYDMSEVSELYPVGTITSNQGSITLSNIYYNGSGWVPGLFSAENTSPLIPWSNYLDKNAQITMDYVYYDHDENVTGRTRQLTMYTDEWQGQSEESVVVEATDHSKFFNEEIMPAVMWEELKVPEIVWRILDTVGFTNYDIHRDSDNVTEHVIPVFYTTGEETVWEVLDELAKASQTAIYFDADGTLQVKTRDYALSAADAPVWTLQSYDDVNQKANIETLEQSTEFQPNSIKVIYQKTNWSKFNKGMPSMQQVWEPEAENVVLRASQLRRTLEIGDNNFWLGADDVKVWPYEGIISVGGEIIKYEGKHFVYYDETNTRRTTIVKSPDERKKVQRNRAGAGYKRKSHFTGGMRIVERGLWNSEVRRHPVEAEGYSVRHIVNGTRRTDVHGFRHLKEESRVQLNTGKRFKDYKDLLVATRGQADDLPFFHYGTKFRFVRDKSRTHQVAGMVIHNSGTNEDGYYVEMTISKNFDAKKRARRGELTLYSRVGGKHKRLGSRDLAIGENIYYDLDVAYTPDDGKHKLQISVNGKECINVTVEGANRNAANGRFGLYARGKTKAQFEYLYAIRREPKELPHDFSFLDKIKRAYVGDTWLREWVFKWKNYKRRVKKKSRKARKRHNRYFYDEFGPFVHEVRQFDVKFEPAPVLHSRLYMTNDWSNICLEYVSTPFGAKFTLVNTARNNTVIHGEDKLSYAGTNKAINQILTTIGRPLIIDEDEEVLVENSDQIRIRGKIESELTSTWIQSKSMANDVANWIRDNWTYGNESLTVNIFGNPLLEVGDVVRVEYPEKHISGDYFVNGVRNNFESGVSTSLSLRRRIN